LAVSHRSHGPSFLLSHLVVVPSSGGGGGGGGGVVVLVVLGLVWLAVLVVVLELVVFDSQKPLSFHEQRSVGHSSPL